MIFLKEFFKKVHFEKHQQETKTYAKLPTRLRVNSCILTLSMSTIYDTIHKKIQVILTVLHVNAGKILYM